MDKKEQYRQLADRLNGYNLRFKDVWLRHIRLNFVSAEVNTTLPANLITSLVRSPETVTTYEMRCEVTGSLYHYEDMKLLNPPDDATWNDPEKLATTLEEIFDTMTGYKTYYVPAGFSYEPPFALKIKLDYEHHCAAVAAAATEEKQ